MGKLVAIHIMFGWMALASASFLKLLQKMEFIVVRLVPTVGDLFPLRNPVEQRSLGNTGQSPRTTATYGTCCLSRQ
jgi:hypothetical protein